MSDNLGDAEERAGGYPIGIFIVGTLFLLGGGGTFVYELAKNRRLSIQAGVAIAEGAALMGLARHLDKRQAFRGIDLEAEWNEDAGLVANEMRGWAVGNYNADLRGHFAEVVIAIAIGIYLLVLTVIGHFCPTC